MELNLRKDLDITNFMDKAYSYQLFFNLVRTNSYKENKTPWQLAHEKRPDLPISIAMIPPVDICSLLTEIPI